MIFLTTTKTPTPIKILNEEDARDRFRALDRQTCPCRRSTYSYARRRAPGVSPESSRALGGGAAAGPVPVDFRHFFARNHTRDYPYARLRVEREIQGPTHPSTHSPTDHRARPARQKLSTCAARQRPEEQSLKPGVG